MRFISIEAKNNFEYFLSRLLASSCLLIKLLTLSGETVFFSITYLYFPSQIIRHFDFSSECQVHPSPRNHIPDLIFLINCIVAKHSVLNFHKSFYAFLRKSFPRIDSYLYYSCMYLTFIPRNDLFQKYLYRNWFCLPNYWCMKTPHFFRTIFFVQQYSQIQPSR